MGVYTSPDNLYKPDPGESGWGALVNTNFDTIQSKLGGSVLIPGADPTGVTDSTTAVAAYLNGLAANSTVILKPAIYLLNAAITNTLTMAADITIFSYGVVFYLNVGANVPIFIISGAHNLDWYGLEFYGYTAKTVTVASGKLIVLTGTAAAGTLTNLVLNSGTAGSQTPSGQPDATRRDTSAWYARDRSGHTTGKWQLSQTGTPGANDCLIVYSENQRDQDVPNVAPAMAIDATGPGPVKNITIYGAWAFEMEDGTQTGIGPIGAVTTAATPSNVSLFVTNPPTNIGPGVIALLWYRTGNSATLATLQASNFTLIDTVNIAGGAIAGGKYVDQQNSLSGLDTLGGETTIIRPGLLTATPTDYTAQHFIHDAEQRITCWVQRITPANSNPITLAQVKEIGRVTDGLTLDGGGQDNQDFVRAGTGARNFRFTDPVMEGAGGCCFNFATGTDIEGMSIVNPRLRAACQNVVSVSGGSLSDITGSGYLGECAHSPLDNEPETVSTAMRAFSLGPIHLRNWGSGYGYHCGGFGRMYETTFNGTQFEQFMGANSILGGATGLQGRVSIRNNSYAQTTDNGINLHAINASLDVMIEGNATINIVADTAKNTTQSSLALTSASETGSVGTLNSTQTRKSLNFDVGDTVRVQGAKASDFTNATLWNDTFWSITAITGSSGAWVITGTNTNNPVVTGLATGTFSAATIQKLVSTPTSGTCHIRAFYQNVADPVSLVTVSAANSRVDVTTNDGVTHTIVTAGQTGYIGVITAAPVSGTYVAGAWGNDPTHSKIWQCTVGGTPGTWKSVAVA